MGGFSVSGYKVSARTLLFTKSCRFYSSVCICITTCVDHEIKGHVFGNFFDFDNSDQIYTILILQFGCSRSFGKSYLRAGNMDWGLKFHEMRV